MIRNLYTSLFPLCFGHDSVPICGYHVEDIEHILLHCALYQLPRQKMMQTIIRPNVEFNDINVAIFVYGEERYSLITSKSIFSAHFHIGI